MKKIKGEAVRPFIAAVIESGQSNAILSGAVVVIEVNGFKYCARWDNEKGLYAESKI